MERPKWGVGRTICKPHPKNLYEPFTPGYKIMKYNKGFNRYMAVRGRGTEGVVQTAVFYSIEDAKKWLDNLPEYPDMTPGLGREWTKNYIKVNRNYFPVNNPMN